MNKTNGLKTISLFNRTLSSYKKYVNTINLKEDLIKNLTDDDIREKILLLKTKTTKEKKLTDETICTSFALTREASRRVIGLRHFDSQLLGGLILNEGKIAEMKTGEGKTLVATLPSVTQSLFSKGMQVVTVNDYLAKRDFEWMGKIYKFLGLNVGLIQSEMETTLRKKNYNCDITYVTNSELGFDYLRDNMATIKNEIVQQKFHYCIIDEVDSILIDEARTPLIISGEIDTEIDKYVQTSELINYLVPEKDYEIEEKTKNISLTSYGIGKCEQILGISKIFDSSEAWVSYILNALKAKIFYKKNVNYIVQNNNVIIVDEFTGRIMPDRRWSEGLHQSIEAKENLPIKSASQTVASITYQNLFLLYPRFAGMTGTAKSAEMEFEKIYKANVIVIPTTKPIQREDLADLVFIDEIAKWKAVAKECFDMYKKGRPVLVGTTTVESSEILSQLLNDYKIKHNLLNAKPENVKKESEIIATAGQLNAVTIATNMAGRGTDILLGGNPKVLAKNFILNYLFSSSNSSSLNIINTNELSRIQSDLNRIKDKIQELNIDFETVQTYIDSTDNSRNGKNDGVLNNIIVLYKIANRIFEQQTIEESKKVKELGGLYVIGTERHDSRRIDNQLRGRAGRQGDPGSSRFFVSLNDKLLRLFGGERLQTILRQLDPENDIPLSFNFLSKSLDDAQEKVETYYYGIRKQLFDYDQVLNIHRQIIYTERKKILELKNCRLWLLEYSEGAVQDIINTLLMTDQTVDKRILRKFIYFIEEWLGLNLQLYSSSVEKLTISEFRNLIYEQIWISYDLKEAELEIYEPGLVRVLEKFCLLKAIDEHWTQHLQELTDLRESVSFAVYAQTDPLSDYKATSTDILINTIQQIRQSAIFQFVYSEIVYGS